MSIPKQTGNQVLPGRSLFLFLCLAIFVTVFAFWKNYFGVLRNLPEIATFRIHLHALMMSVWLLMLAVQAWLIRDGNFTVHRWIGRTSYVVAPMMVWTGLVLIHEVLNRTPPLPLAAVRLNVYSFGQLILFSVVWGLAIRFRREVKLHMRFMISTLFAIGTAIVFRIFFLWIPMFNTFDAALPATWATMGTLLLILIFLDWKKGIVRSPYWIILILICLMHILYYTISTRSWFLSFSDWYADLPPWIFFG